MMILSENETKELMRRWRYILTSEDYLRGNNLFEGKCGHSASFQAKVWQTKCTKTSSRHLKNLKFSSPSPSKIFRSDIVSEYPYYRALPIGLACAHTASHQQTAPNLEPHINRSTFSIFFNLLVYLRWIYWKILVRPRHLIGAWKTAPAFSYKKYFFFFS